jgi:hypothetical protein
MKKEKQSTLDIIKTKSKESCACGCKDLNVKVHNIETLDIKYDTRDIQIISIDGALIDIQDGGEGHILFYHSPLLKDPSVSIVKCPFEIRLSRLALLDFVEDLSIKTTAFLLEEKSKMKEDCPKKKQRDSEMMFR